MTKNTDFFDDDLIRSGGKRMHVGVEQDAEEGGSSTVAARPASDVNLTRMARYRGEVEDQVAKTTEELERLRQRQDALEKEKRSLQELRDKQDDFESSKREMLDNLSHSLLTMERDEIRLSQTIELINTSRSRFKTMQQDIETIKEDEWSDEEQREELNRALSVLEDARMEFSKITGKITAQMSDEQSGDGAPQLFEHLPSSRARQRDAVEAPEQTFVYWMKVGLAISIPFIVAAAILLLVTFFVKGDLVV